MKGPGFGDQFMCHSYDIFDSYEELDTVGDILLKMSDENYDILIGQSSGGSIFLHNFYAKLDKNPFIINIMEKKKQNSFLMKLKMIMDKQFMVLVLIHMLD